MTTAKQREQAARIRADRRFWHELVTEVEERVGRDAMHEPGPMGDWTFCDLVAHLAAWRDVQVRQLEAVARRRPMPRPPWPVDLEDDDAINDWIHERDRDRTLDEVLTEYDESFERLAKAIEALAEPVAHDPRSFAWADGTALVDGDFTGHLHEEHLPAIRAWLETRDG